MVDRGQRADRQAGHRPGEVRPIDDKAAAAASKKFIDVVEKSRGAIQKCYEQALKKNTGLQATTITLTVTASFAQPARIETARSRRRSATRSTLHPSGRDQVGAADELAGDDVQSPGVADAVVSGELKELEKRLERSPRTSGSG